MKPLFPRILLLAFSLAGYVSPCDVNPLLQRIGIGNSARTAFPKERATIVESFVEHVRGVLNQLSGTDQKSLLRTLQEIEIENSPIAAGSYHPEVDVLTLSKTLQGKIAALFVLVHEFNHAVRVNTGIKATSTLGPILTKMDPRPPTYLLEKTAYLSLKRFTEDTTRKVGLDALIGILAEDSRMSPEVQTKLRKLFASAQVKSGKLSFDHDTIGLTREELIELHGESMKETLRVARLIIKPLHMSDYEYLFRSIFRTHYVANMAQESIMKVVWYGWALVFVLLAITVA